MKEIDERNLDFKSGFGKNSEIQTLFSLAAVDWVSSVKVVG